MPRSTESSNDININNIVDAGFRVTQKCGHHNNDWGTLKWNTANSHRPSGCLRQEPGAG